MSQNQARTFAPIRHTTLIVRACLQFAGLSVLLAAVVLHTIGQSNAVFAIGVCGAMAYIAGAAPMKCPRCKYWFHLTPLRPWMSFVPSSCPSCELPLRDSTLKEYLQRRRAEPPTRTREFIAWAGTVGFALACAILVQVQITPLVDRLLTGLTYMALVIAYPLTAPAFGRHGRRSTK